MSILQRYILKQLLRNLALSVLALTSLFLLFDFFDRIDNMIAAGAQVGVVLQYFLYKIPLTLTLMFPIAMLVATLLTYGLLSKNSEITAIRASGIPLSWIGRPLLYCGLTVSLLAITLNETLVPFATRRVKEIYNIDIRQKDKTGTYSQNEFWWRSQDRFFSVNMFDSRRNVLLDLSYFDVDPEFRVTKRTDADSAEFLDKITGWSMRNVNESRFSDESGSLKIDPKRYSSYPLPITQEPREFYDVRADRDTMSFSEMRRFIKRQLRSGVPVSGLYADMHEKLAFPFVNLLATLVALPFALKPARSGSMAVSIMAGLVIGFSYFAVHYFSVALGRAELWPPLLAAWMANILMGFIAIVLNLGAESPQ